MVCVRGGGSERMFSPKTYGPYWQAKREDNQGSEKARKRFRLAGISDRPFYRADQKAHRASQKESERFPFPPRRAENGIKAKKINELSGRQGRKSLQEACETTGSQIISLTPGLKSGSFIKKSIFEMNWDSIA